jgi:hypothetical protein
VNLVEQVDSYRWLIQRSFDNATGAVEHVHQRFAEMSFDVLHELGLPQGVTDRSKAKHGRVMHTIYEGVRYTNAEIGDLVVRQFDQISRFASNLNASLLPSPTVDQPLAERGGVPGDTATSK